MHLSLCVSPNSVLLLPGAAFADSLRIILFLRTYNVHTATGANNANSLVSQLTTIQHTDLRVRERIVGKDTLRAALASPLMLISRWCIDTVHECLERVVTACSPLSIEHHVALHEYTILLPGCKCTLYPVTPSSGGAD